MVNIKTFAQQSISVGVVQVITSLYGIILLPILTKNLAIEEYGLWLLLTAIFGLSSGILGLGLPFSMLRYLPSIEDISEQKQIFYSILFTTVTVSVFFSFIISSILVKFEYLSIVPDVYIIELAAIFVVLQVAYVTEITYFQAYKQIKKYSFFILCTKLFDILFISIAVYSGFKLQGILMAHLIAHFFTFIFMQYTIFKQIGFEFPKFKNINKFISFGFPTIPGNLSSWITNSSDRYLIGLFLGSSWVGYYGPGYSLGNIIGNFTKPVMFLLTTTLSKEYDYKNFSEVKHILVKSLKYFLALAIPSVFGLSLLSKPLLEVLATPEIAINGYLITPIVASSFLLFGIYTFIMRYFILEEKVRFLRNVWIIACILNFSLNIFFIPWIGILGAALTTLFSFLFALTMGEHYSEGLLNVKEIQYFILKSVFSSLVMSIPILIITPSGIVEIISTIGLCALIYFISIYVVSGFSKEEICFFKSLFKIKNNS